MKIYLAIWAICAYFALGFGFIWVLKASKQDLIDVSGDPENDDEIIGMVICWPILMLFLLVAVFIWLIKTIAKEVFK